MRPRVVITGIGAVTPVGTGRDAWWANLLAGRCGFSPVEAFDTRAYRVHRGAEVKGFRPADHVRTGDPAGVGRTAALAIAAARLALEDAGLAEGDLEPARTGVAVGTTSGEPQVIEAFNDRYLGGRLEEAGPELLSAYPCHTMAAQVAGELARIAHRASVLC